MAEYIEKQRAKDLMGCCLASAKAEYKAAKDVFTKAKFEDYIETIQAMIDVVGAVEVADVQPVKRGRWIAQLNGHVSCSYCGKEQAFSSDFCKHCGADMREPETTKG